jgi:Cu(I)/Ag(I) efflux system membrane protein CusA/SilA
MIDRVLTFSIRHRWLIVLAGVLLAAWGIRSAYRTPIDAIPDLSENQVIVFTDWPGHGPREIEEQVSYPLALKLKGLAGVRVVRSSSDVGFSLISVILQEDANWEAARRQIGDVLSRPSLRLPEGTAARLAPDAAATGQIFWYTVEGPNYELGRLRAIQDWYVRPQLAAVPGVAEVASVGGLPLEYQVELDPYRLRAYGIKPSQVADAVKRANAAAGGNVVHKGNAEFVARGIGWLGARPGDADAGVDPQRVLRDLENVRLTAADGTSLPLSDVARVALGSQPRRGILEKDGHEGTGGVVLMRHGENALEVTRRLRAKIQELEPGLPPGVGIVPVYDRTPLIHGTIGTVTSTLLEAIVAAAVCILVVLRHVRTAFIIALTLPLAVLMSFGLMDLLRSLGIADVETNLMSLAGLAISIGVLVDSSIVMAENAMHRLKRRFGDEPVRGDTRAEVLAACREVGRPIFFSVVIILLSFLPVFALGGLDGKLFHPLAFTKSFAMFAVGLLAITLVPALCTLFVKGKLRREEEVGLVRRLMRVYRPVLDYFLDRPAGIVWFLGLTLIVAATLCGKEWLLRIMIAVALLTSFWAASTWRTRLATGLSLVLVALLAGQYLKPLGHEPPTPLDEGMTMDMPISWPTMSATQAADDLLARDMVFCRFPEVSMVVGKAGRAETATDPAPLDMIETMIDFRPREFWPRRCLRPKDAEAQAAAVLDALAEKNLIRAPVDAAARQNLANGAAMEAVALFDAQMREAAYQRNKELERALGPRLARFTIERLVEMLEENGSLTRVAAEKGLMPLVDRLIAGHTAHLAMEPTPEAVASLVRDVLRKLTDLHVIEPGADPTRLKPSQVRQAWDWLHSELGGQVPGFLGELTEAVRDRHRELWRAHTVKLNAELLERGAGVYTRLVLESLFQKSTITDERVVAAMHEWHRVRYAAPDLRGSSAEHHQEGGHGPLPFLEPVPELAAIQSELSERFGRGLLLWPRERVELAGFGGELDRAMQMPGWTNVWTMPIQNRVDMLATGVNTTVGVRVLGRRVDDIEHASKDIAAVLKAMPGATQVITDPVRGKRQLEVFPDRGQAVRLGVDAGDVTDLVEIALGGRVVTTTVEGRERHPVRVRYARAFREDEDTVRDLPVLVQRPGGGQRGEFAHVPLATVADVRITEGPAVIKGENGLLRNYVRLNVRDRDAAEFVEAAQQRVAAEVSLPEGVFVEWTGQFEHEVRTRRTLTVAVPLVIVLIFLILWWTYRDLTDALLMLLAIPGALAGGVLCQWLFGYPFTVTVWVGYIACFGMATSTGIIMLVYLRQAVAQAGGMEKLTAVTLREAVLNGAAHRLRPKLLTEATTLLSLAPLLLATGTGSEVLRPMVVPVLGGLLIADEVIDLLLPVLFYRVRLRRLAPTADARVMSSRKEVASRVAL